MKVPFGCQRCGGVLCLSQPTFQGRTLEELWKYHEKEMRDFIRGLEHCRMKFLEESLPGFLEDFKKLGTTVV